MKQEQAEIIAIQALGWLVGEEDMMGVFLASTGTDVNNLKQSVGDPAFLIAVLDFLMQDDSHVVRFCDAQSLPYETPMQARQSLPGGAMINWT